MFGNNIPNDGGQVTICIDDTNYVVYFCKIEDGWSIIGHTKI